MEIIILGYAHESSHITWVLKGREPLSVMFRERCDEKRRVRDETLLVLKKEQGDP